MRYVAQSVSDPEDNRRAQRIEEAPGRREQIGREECRDGCSAGDGTEQLQSLGALERKGNRAQRAGDGQIDPRTGNESGDKNASHQQRGNTGPLIDEKSKEQLAGMPQQGPAVMSPSINPAELPIILGLPVRKGLLLLARLCRSDLHAAALIAHGDNLRCTGGGGATDLAKAATTAEFSEPALIEPGGDPQAEGLAIIGALIEPGVVGERSLVIGIGEIPRISADDDVFLQVIAKP